MSLKTPSFWYPQGTRKTPWEAAALKPLAFVYAFFYRLHQGFVEPEKIEIPVVCIGNLVAGGTGKTPTSIAVLEFLKQEGFAKKPYFLLRGYGGAERGPVVVNPEKHTAWDVGDESLILARHAPTIVSADRVAGAELARSQGADLVLMDDGLQNPGIQKDFSIIVVNGEMGFGNKHMMPAGPLREPLKRGLSKGDAFILIGEDKTAVSALLPPGKPVINAHLETEQDSIPSKKQRYFAFAGLGYPDKFFNYLKGDLGLDVVETKAYADHYPYGEYDLQELHTQASGLEAALITTEKDRLRLPANDSITVHSVPVKMVLEGTDLLKAALQEKLG